MLRDQTGGLGRAASVCARRLQAYVAYEVGRQMELNTHIVNGLYFNVLHKSRYHISSISTPLLLPRFVCFLRST